MIRVCGQAGEGLYSQRAMTSARSWCSRARSTALSSRPRASLVCWRDEDACETAGAESTLRRARSSRRWSIELENRTSAASSPTTTPTATATATRPAMPARPRSGPLATPRVTAPTSSPKTSVSGTTASVDQRVESLTAKPATSQASTAPNSTTAPATAWVDRSWRSPSSRQCPPPSQVSGPSIHDANERGSADSWAHISSKHLQVFQASQAGGRHTESKRLRVVWFTMRQGGCGSHPRDTREVARRVPGRHLTRNLLRREQISNRSGRRRETV